MVDKRPRCYLCQYSTSPVDFWEVPEKVIGEVAQISRDLASLNRGWFWCAECNEYLHQPTIQAAKEAIPA